MSAKHKLQGKDWKSTIFHVNTIRGIVMEIDDGFIDIDDIDDATGKINSCSRRDGAGNKFELVGEADKEGVDQPKIRLAKKGAAAEELPRYAGQLIFEVTWKGKPTKIIIGAILHDDIRRADQQQDTWIAVKQG